MESRTVITSPHWNKLFAALDPDDDEIHQAQACLRSLESEPQKGHSFRYDLYSGLHWVIEIGRFVIVYQFSETQVRAKDIFLGERWQ